MTASDVIQVDYNHRDPSGQYLRRKLPVIQQLNIGDEVIVYEPNDGTEADALVVFVGDEWANRRTTSVWMHRTVHLWVVPGSERDLHQCSTLCDADCDAYCHEGHLVPWKRESGHPFPRIANKRKQ